MSETCTNTECTSRRADHLLSAADGKLRPQGGLFVSRSVTFAVRSPRAGSGAFLKRDSRGISAIAPDTPLTQVRTLEDVYDRSMARTSFTLVRLAIAAGNGLLLASWELRRHSYAVAQRTREIGFDRRSARIRER